MFSIIIPTHNRYDLLQRTLYSLINLNNDFKNCEILVIDNNSTDNTKQIAESAIRSYPENNIKYFYEPIPGLLSGRHRGTLEARGDILIFVDDDIEADENWLQAIEDTFTDPNVQIVGGRNLPRYEISPPDWLEWFWIAEPNGKTCDYLSLLDFGDSPCEIDPNFVWGLNFSIRKQVLFDLGGFHPDCIPRHLQHFQGDGESGLTQNAKDRGYTAFYQPKAVVWHWISKERMTYEYFDQRSFYQGVCTSYAEIRKKGGLPSGVYLIGSLKSLLRPYKRTFVNSLRKNTQELILRERFWMTYQYGYQFHQKMVRHHPKLLEWVLKEDYWDYALPDITIKNEPLQKIIKE